MISQGTVSILFGTHSPVHTILVFLSWKQVHGTFPSLWQMVCIALHDVGHIGKNYLDSVEEKEDHWHLGARIAGRLFGRKGYNLISGHCTASGCPQSELYKPDKYSWYIAPRLWLFMNTLVEPKLATGCGRWEAVDKFKKSVKESIESGEYRSTHDIYLDRCKEAQKEKEYED